MEVSESEHREVSASEHHSLIKEVSEDEHRRVVRGELDSIARSAKWVVRWLAVTAVAVSVIATFVAARL